MIDFGSIGRGFARPIAESVGSAVAIQAFLLVTGIVASRLLGPEDRGHFALVLLCPLAISALVLFGFQNSITYYVARSPESVHTVLQATYQVFLWQALLGTGLHLASLYVFFGDEPGYVQEAAVIALPVTSILLIQAYGLALVQGCQKFRVLSLLRIAPLMSYALIICLSLAIGFDSLLAFTVSWVAANGLSALVIAYSALAIANDQIPTEFSENLVGKRELISFGAKSFAGSVSPVETFRIDQAMIGLALPAADLGIYVAALSFTNLPRFLSQSLGFIAFPAIAAAESVSAARRLTFSFFWLTALLTGVMCLVLIAVADWMITLLLGNSFQPAVPVARILILSSFLISLRRILSDCLRGAGYPEAGSWAEIAFWCSLVALLPGAIWQWGLHGAAWALVFGSAIGLSLILLYLVRRQGSQSHTLCRLRLATDWRDD